MLKIDKYFKKIQMKRDIKFCGNDRLACCRYKMAVVIPIYGEYDYIGQTLCSLSANMDLDETLVMLVINNPAEGSNSRYVKENLLLLRELNDESFQKSHDRQRFGQREDRSSNQQIGNLSNNFPSKEMLNRLNLAWIDASTKGQELPGKGGVGMARKLGMDSVLNYLKWNDDPLIISLDSDTLVEENYIEAIGKFFNVHKDISAASIDFKHLPGDSPEEERAVREYEFSIKYYIENLKKAGSPYAYHTIGSAMVCRADAYIRAGGMKLHRGGEDFYFMQGLRKLAPIMEITDTTVYQSARPSDRVPFGTGPKVKECLNGKEIKLYNPKIFDVLKETLRKAESWIYAENISEARQFISLLPEEANAYFTSLSFDAIWPNILNNNVKKKNDLSIKDREKLLWAFHVWFDAFKTLKFVHYLERNYPEIYSKIDIVML